MQRAIVRITVQGGVVANTEFLPATGDNPDDTPLIQIWDFDCEGDGGAYTNSEGEEFNLGVIEPEIISLKDLQCKAIEQG
jgi:hypothetical protein